MSLKKCTKAMLIDKIIVLEERNKTLSKNNYWLESEVKVLKANYNDIVEADKVSNELKHAVIEVFQKIEEIKQYVL